MWAKKAIRSFPDSWAASREILPPSVSVNSSATSGFLTLLSPFTLSTSSSAFQSSGVGGRPPALGEATLRSALTLALC